MIPFVDKLFVEYPVPKQLSCWGSVPGSGPVEDLSTLVESAVDELASDVHITESIEASGMATLLPEGTITVKSAMLSSIYPFQGNRLVKVTYNAASRIAYLRFYPAIITYSRRLFVSDLNTLVGDRLIYVKAYCHWKMAEKELEILKAVNMNVDNGQIDFSVLEDFRNKRYEYYINMKPEILMYSTVN